MGICCYVHRVPVNSNKQSVGFSCFDLIFVEGGGFFCIL
jgi:hypothetical protein